MAQWMIQKISWIVTVFPLKIGTSNYSTPFTELASNFWQRLSHAYIINRSTQNTRANGMLNIYLALKIGQSSSVILTGQHLHKEEGSRTVPLLELFCWNAINIHELPFSYARFTLRSDTLTTAHGLHAVRSALVCQVSTVVVHACISWSCCDCKICIFMFPRIGQQLK